MRLPGSRRNRTSAAWMAAMAVCLLVSAGHIAAAPPSPGSSEVGPGSPARVETALDTKADALAFARASRTRDALSFPVGVNRIGRHVRDGFEGAEYDQIDELDPAGRVTAITQFDSKGRLRAAIRLGSTPMVGPRVTPDGAVESAQRSALVAGLNVGTPTSTEADQATGGWTVHWARVQDGVRVRGDETRICVWPDGRIQSLSRVEHVLAAAPAQPIGQENARQVAADNLDRWFARGSAYAIQSVTLAWVEPNGAFDPTRITTAPAPYRLAWVTEVKPSGDAASYMWLITLFVDATDGTIIGGDFVE